MDMAERDDVPNNVTTNIDGELAARVDEYQEDLGIEHRKTAMNRVTRLGLEKAGYIGPMEATTWLMRATKGAAFTFFVVGVMWAFTGAHYDLGGVMKLGYGSLAAAVLATGCYSALERREPAVSRRLSSLVDPRTDLDAETVADGGERE